MSRRVFSYKRSVGHTLQWPGPLRRLHRGCSRRHPAQAVKEAEKLVGSRLQGTSTDYDAVIILGGGLTVSGDLPAWVERRLAVARHLFAQQDPQRCYCLCLGAGTPHKPAFLRGQHVHHESTACTEYLIEQGVPAARILKETSSFDTVGNAYFAATVHAIPAQWRSCAVVTSAFHMPRTEAIFRTCFALASASVWGSEDFVRLTFHSASDDGLFDSTAISARGEREAQSLEEWVANAAKLHTLKDLHSWLYSTHLCYAVTRQNDFGRATVPGGERGALATY